MAIRKEFWRLAWPAAAEGLLLMLLTAADLLEQALTAIASFDICREHGIIVAESAADKVLPELPAPYRLYREYRYGKIRLSVYHRSGNEDETT